MSQNCTTLEEFSKDKRIPCKYGAKCYQKNPTHHNKYKHPPKKQDALRGLKQAAKKLKVETEDKQIEAVKIDEDVSETDDDEAPRKKEVVSDTDQSESEDSQPATTDTTETTKILDKIVAKDFIKEKFLVDMPMDFYEFWSFCKSLKPGTPSEALKEVGLSLVGPYDVLAGKFDGLSDKPGDEYLIHWRYFYDPPEFQTVIKGDVKSGFHVGYWRDSPEKPPVFMVSNKAKVDGIITTMGENIFAAVNIHLEEVKKTGDPFQKMSVGKYQKPLIKKAEDLKLNLSHKTDNMRNRDKKIVTRTFNKIGLTVPYDKKSQLGYRELALDNKDLTKILNKLAKAPKDMEAKYLSELQPCLTYASIALDECDFGTGIELGWNLMAHGVKTVNATISRFLKSSYQLLNRESFAKIAEAHMKNRKEGCDLSII